MNAYTKILNSNNTNSIFKKCSKLAKMIISILIFFVFVYLSVASVLGTTSMIKTQDTDTFLTYNYDNIIINIVCIILFLILMFTIFNSFLEKVDTNILLTILWVYTMILGLIWIVSVRTVPVTDSKILINASLKLAQGDYSPFNFDENTYFYRYPFQLGYVLLCQIVISLFKNHCGIILQCINIFSLCVIYSGIVKIVDATLHNKKITNITIFLFFGCIQAILFTTFMYGNFIGLAFGIWAIYFAIRYIQNDSKKINIFICAILLAISIALKPNNMIILAGICIVLLIKFLDTKKLFDIISIIICIFIGSNLINVIVSGYEHQANVDLGSGTPKILWINIGVHESSSYKNGHGWYNYKYIKKIFLENNLDTEKSSEVAKEQILERLEYFKNNPEYANKFFTEKILSQWNDPTYSSIWVSERCPHSSEIPSFVESIYYGKGNKLMLFIMNNYQQIIFIFACVSFGILYKKKDVSLYIMPLVVLGGFLYHLIFEAKTQYAMTYFIMLIPMASCGLYAIMNLNFMNILKNIIKIDSSQKVDNSNNDSIN